MSEEREFPDTLLLNIFMFLDSHQEVARLSQVCWQWYRVSRDEILWKKLLLKDFRIAFVQLQLRPIDSWYAEYRRIVDESPIVESETLDSHTDEVLHVAFSKNGRLFASCSKDCSIKIWENNWPCRLKYDEDLGAKFNWKYSQWSEFSEDDALILVSGKLKSENTSSGEISVFEFGDQELVYRCRVLNQPYDFIGCWYNRNWVIGAECIFHGDATSCSKIFLCRSSQELQSEKERVSANLFKFINFNASMVRMVHVGQYVSDWLRRAVRIAEKASQPENKGKDLESLGQMVDEEPEEMNSADEECMPGPSNRSFEPSISSNSDLADRLLIFTTASQTYTPHQIGFKLLKARSIERLLGEEVMPRSRLDKIKERMEQVRNDPSLNDTPNINNPFGMPLPIPMETFAQHNLTAADFQQYFDFADHVIDMRGHVIGLALSPDHRQLYVNVRPWPEGATISSMWAPPPIAQQVEVRVIDLERLVLQNDVIYRGHKGFTPNEECCFVFLDISEHFVASGSEDKNVYLWDRRYGNLIAKLPHKSLVSSVAFSSTFDSNTTNESNKPKAELMVSASDDATLKVWRSKRIMRILKEQNNSGQ